MERFHLKLTDSIPVHRIEVDLASKTPKQEGNEEKINYEDIEYSHPHEEADKLREQNFVNMMLAALVQGYDETTPMYNRRGAEVAHATAISAQESSYDIYLTQFIPKHTKFDMPITFCPNKITQKL